MTRDLALSLLRQGSNGDSILQILETIAGDDTMPDARRRQKKSSSDTDHSPPRFAAGGFIIWGPKRNDS